jgi:hypothetical protein
MQPLPVALLQRRLHSCCSHLCLLLLLLLLLLRLLLLLCFLCNCTAL